MRPRTSCSADSNAGWSVGDVLRDAGDEVGHGVRGDEVAVGKALHHRACAEAVGAVVGEVRLADREQAGDRGLELVVHPQAAHRVMRGGVDHHRRLPWRVAGDPLVHLEEVPVAVRDHVGAAL